MPPHWLKSPHTFFSRSSSLNSIPTLSTPQTSQSSQPHLTSSSDEDEEGTRILTPFEREYGRPDLPGGWLDGKALQKRLREVSVARGNKETDSPAHLDKDLDSSKNEFEKDIRVTRLMVHPIKSCRGISLQKSVLTPQGLEFDRQWAIREVTSGKLLTAREYPEMVLIKCEIDEPSNQLRVSFPSASNQSITSASGSTTSTSNGSLVHDGQRGAEEETAKMGSLPGFSVDLRAEMETMSGWEKLPCSQLFGGSIPPSLLVPACTTDSIALNPTPSPSEQLSTYLKKPVQLIRTSPLKEDQRKCEVPPGIGEAEEWIEGLDRLRQSGVVDEEEEEEDVVTGYADGYPLLIANEESYRSVSSNILQSTRPSPPSHLASTFGTLDSEKSAWSTKSFDHRRFRANVVVGCSRDLPLELRDDLSRDVGRGGAGKEEGKDQDEEENQLKAWEEETWRELEFTGHDSSSSSKGKKGGLICTSRCGRCQLPNVCPDTAEQDKVVPYKIIAKYRRVDPAQKFVPIFGVNAISTNLKGSFEVAVGDRVKVVSQNRWGSLPITSTNGKS